MKKQTYESALQELQEILQAVEQGGIGLSELTEKLDRAAELIAHSKAQLFLTKEKVEQVVTKWSAD